MGVVKSVVLESCSCARMEKRSKRSHSPFSRVRASSFARVPVQEETLIYVTASSRKLTLQSFKRPIVKKLEAEHAWEGSIRVSSQDARLRSVQRHRYWAGFESAAAICFAFQAAP